MEIVKEQTKVNRYFFFDFLWKAWRWQMHVIVEAARLEGVPIVQGYNVCLQEAGDEHRCVCQVGEGAGRRTVGA